MNYQSLRPRPVLAACAILAIIATATHAQEKKPSVDVSGLWVASVVTDQGSGHPTFDFKQDGQKLSGTYKGMFGRSTLEGTLEGSVITFSFKTWSPLNPLSKLLISYRGSIDSATMEMKGTVDFGGQGTGTWTARRQKQ